jgi:Hg(II)-responsive transcriptional regulator
MERERLHIGEVAARAGVNVQTLRYYERRGLLDEPERSRSGYRRYPLETVRLIKFIKRAQELGFTLTEVEDLLRLRQVRRRDRQRIRALAEGKVRDVDEKIRQLKSIRDALGKLVDSCVCAQPELECPILEALDDKTLPSAWMRSGSKRSRDVA